MTRNAVIVLFLFLLPQPGYSTAYYISPAGDDNNDGMSTHKPWRSIARVNSHSFSPGDQILFKGGETFDGGLYFDEKDIGDPANPIKIGSYGGQKALIQSGAKRGMFLYNTAGFDVSNLVFHGNGLEEGILVYSDQSQQTLRHIYMNELEVSGYYNAGISIGYNGDEHIFTAFADIDIRHCDIHDNTDVGIFIWGRFEFGRPAYQIEDVYVGHNRVYRHHGIKNNYKHSGNGILLANTRRALVEFNEAFENGGQNNNAREGPVGIWAWESTEVTFQYNVSHHNRSQTQDGGGFDFDGGVTHSVMQYNYSHHNDGPGFLITQIKEGNPVKGNLIRFNISENDAQHGNKSGILLYAFDGSSGIHDLVIHNNTVIVDKKYNGAVRALYMDGGGAIEKVGIYNNLFISRGGAPLVDIGTAAFPKLVSNAYHDYDLKNTYTYHRKNYKSLDELQRSTGQELLRDKPVGFEGDPRITMPQGITRESNPMLLSGIAYFRLQPDSPLIDRGIDLVNEFGIESIQSDFFGQAPVFGAAPDIGAFEYNAPLPVRFLRLYAEKTPEGIELKWIVVQESNHSHYEVERSMDGITFMAIGHVNSDITLRGPRQYSFIDDFDLNLPTYYRIRQVDFDGKGSTYSEVIKIQSQPSLISVEVSPNPTFDGQFTLRISGRYSYLLCDLNGRTLESGNGAGNRTFYIENPDPGCYILHIANENQVISQKIIVL